MKFLPRDIDNFAQMILGDYLYIDKTKYIYQMYATKDRYHFLSRPRCFGKSLLVSTLKELFSGNKKLFEGLWIERESDFAWQQHPIIHLDFSKIPHFDPKELRENINLKLTTIAQEYGLTIQEKTPEAALDRLITQLAERNTVVFLVDEYDKPILTHIKDPHIADQQREVLKSFYDVLKGTGQHMRAIFITGVTKFSRTSIFSGLNNLDDLSLKPEMAGLLGYTHQEIYDHFMPYLHKVAQKENKSVETIIQELEKWYDGYRFSEDELKVYNPFSVLNYLKDKKFKNYWFTSGTPSFLIELIKKEYYALSDLEHKELSEQALGTFTVEQIPLVAILFQAGYLTIQDYDQESRKYILSFPNKEVHDSFTTHLVAILTNSTVTAVESYSPDLLRALNNGDIEFFHKTIKILFAHIPYNLHMDQERYYHSLFQFMSNLLGLNAQSEVLTDKGRIDLVISTKNYVYLFEFKYNETAQAALEQIEDRKYYERYSDGDKKVILIGLSFNRGKHRFIIDLKSRQL